MVGRAVAVLLAVPVATLVASYVWLALDHGTAWVFPVVVHESGRYTLLETVLYVRHLLRELPVAGLYAAASAGAYTAFGPGASRAPSALQRSVALAVALGLVAGAWAVAAVRAGGAVATAEVLQSYLRDEDVPVGGAHWGYHLLSAVTYFAAAIVLATLLARVFGRPSGAARSPRAMVVPLGAMVALTLACRPTWRLFVAPRYLGHQAREVATHVLTTLPASFAVLLAVASPRPAPVRHPAGVPAGTWLAAAIGALTLAYLGIGAAVAGAVDAARPGVRASSLLGAHVFEHALDYVLVAALVYALAPAVTADATDGTR